MELTFVKVKCAQAEAYATGGGVEFSSVDFSLRGLVIGQEAKSHKLKINPAKGTNLAKSLDLFQEILILLRGL